MDKILPGTRKRQFKLLQIMIENEEKSIERSKERLETLNKRLERIEHGFSALSTNSR